MIIEHDEFISIRTGKIHLFAHHEKWVGRSCRTSKIFKLQKSNKIKLTMNLF